MMITDVHHDSKVVYAIQTDILAPAVRIGETIDTAGFESAELVMRSGIVIAGVATTSFWESDDSGMAGETEVPAEEQLGSLVLEVGSTIGRLGYMGKKRYMRIKITAVGESVIIGEIQGMVLLGHAIHQPTPD